MHIILCTTVVDLFRYLQQYTQYMPLPVHELKDWLGTPTIFVVDCSGAGVLLDHFIPELKPSGDEHVPEPGTATEDGRKGAKAPAAVGAAAAVASRTGGAGVDSGVGRTGQTHGERGMSLDFTATVPMLIMYGSFPLGSSNTTP